MGRDYDERPKKRRRDDGDDDAPRSGGSGAPAGTWVFAIIAGLILCAGVVAVVVVAVRKLEKPPAPAESVPEQVAPSGPLDPLEVDLKAAQPLVPKEPVDRILAGSPRNQLYLADMIDFGPPNGPQQVGKGQLGNGTGAPIKVTGTVSEKGLSACTFGRQLTRIGYALGGKVTTLRGHAGVNDDCPDASAVYSFEIIGDGKELWKATASRASGPFEFRVDMRGVKVLELRAIAPKQREYFAVWLDPVIEK